MMSNCRCLNCGNASLWFNPNWGLYECINPYCKMRFTIGQLNDTYKLKTPNLFGRPNENNTTERVNLGIISKALILCTVLSVVALASVSLIISNDDVVNDVLSTGGKITENVDLVVNRADFAVVDANKNQNAASLPPTIQNMPQVTITISQQAQTTYESAQNPTNSNTLKPNEEYVRVTRGVVAGADGHLIILKNNPGASNPTWEQLKSFLYKDNTDQIPYVLGKFVCADFAERVHNDAESAGIRAAYVCIQVGPSKSNPTGGGHALNAFQTIDHGLVYIDCTDFRPGINADKIVDVVTGKDYIARSLFPQPGLPSIWASMGIVKQIDTIEW